MGDSSSDFLYPFLQEEPARSLEAVLSGLQASTLQKAGEVARMRTDFWCHYGDALVAAATALAGVFASGGQLLTFGNGGSATDAQDAAADLVNPGPGRRPLPAVCLANDIGVVTGVGNDVGFDNVFTRQIIAFGREGDAVLGFSTSGESRNVTTGLERAQSMGLRTIGITGYDGGKMARLGLDHCLIVHSTYIPRIQEVHATIYHTLWALVHERLNAS
ncbi:MAG TPA: SIS domain-containing protein [Anaerolineales bacterium]|nr:SIS domain-containing protein [Anaerolineales bacterium]